LREGEKKEPQEASVKKKWGGRRRPHKTPCYGVVKKGKGETPRRPVEKREGRRETYLPPIALDDLPAVDDRLAGEEEKRDIHRWTG